MQGGGVWRGMTAVSRCPPFLDNQVKVPKYRHKLTAAQLNQGRLANLQGLANVSRTVGVPFFLMHGTLIGWTFNQEILPWDQDLDASIMFEDFEKLHAAAKNKASWGSNTTLFELRGPRNHIEFRVRHVPTGVYTDITSLRKTSDTNLLRNRVQSRPMNTTPPLYMMKSSLHKLWGGHLYRPEDIEPLAPCRINNVWLHCPRRPHSVLVQEYPRYREKSYSRWMFDAASGCWSWAKTTA